LGGIHLIDFLDKKCFITFFHITKKTFRIVLTESEKYLLPLTNTDINRGESVLRIDMDYDKTEDTFQKVTVGEMQDNKNGEYASKLASGFDDEEDEAENIQEAAEIVRKLSAADRIDEIELENFRPSNQTFPQQIANILKNVEGLFLGKGIQTLSKLTDDSIAQFLKLKVNKDMKKVTFHYIHEDLNSKNLVIHLQNFHETFGKIIFLLTYFEAPKKTKVKAAGKAEYTFQNIWRNFGLMFEKLKPREKITILSMIVDGYTLQTFEKGMFSY
jgi:hypothetical protein